MDTAVMRYRWTMGYSGIGFTGHVQRAVKSDHILENFSWAYTAISEFSSKRAAGRKTSKNGGRKMSLAKSSGLKLRIAVSLVPRLRREINREIFRVTSKSYAAVGLPLRARLERIGAAPRISCKQAIGVEKFGRRDSRFSPGTNWKSFSDWQSTNVPESQYCSTRRYFNSSTNEWNE